MKPKCYFEMQCVSRCLSTLLRFARILRNEDKELWIYANEATPSKIEVLEHGLLLLRITGYTYGSLTSWFHSDFVRKDDMNPKNPDASHTSVLHMCAFSDLSVECYGNCEANGIQQHVIVSGKTVIKDEANWDVDDTDEEGVPIHESATNHKMDDFLRFMSPVELYSIAHADALGGAKTVYCLQFEDLLSDDSREVIGVYREFGDLIGHFEDMLRYHELPDNEEDIDPSERYYPKDEIERMVKELGVAYTSGFARTMNPTYDLEYTVDRSILV